MLTMPDGCNVLYMPFNSIQYDLLHNFSMNVCHLLTKLHFWSQSVVSVAAFSVITSEVLSIFFAILVFLRLSKSWHGLIQCLNSSTRRARWRIRKCGFKFFSSNMAYPYYINYPVDTLGLHVFLSAWLLRTQFTVALQNCIWSMLEVLSVCLHFFSLTLGLYVFGSTSLSIRKDPDCYLWLYLNSHYPL